MSITFLSVSWQLEGDSAGFVAVGTKAAEPQADKRVSRETRKFIDLYLNHRHERGRLQIIFDILLFGSLEVDSIAFWMLILEPFSWIV